MPCDFKLISIKIKIQRALLENWQAKLMLIQHRFQVCSQLQLNDKKQQQNTSEKVTQTKMAGLKFTGILFHTRVIVSPL